jgi:acetyltransferase-like isoleucine patch superfamily enzyme
VDHLTIISKVFHFFSEVEQRLYLSKLGSKGRDVTFREGVRIKTPEDLKVGSRVLVNHGSLISAKGGIEIGDDVVIGFSVIITTSEHLGPKFFSHSQHRSISIGSNVWIGAGAIVNPGAKIGSNVIIGSGAVVTGTIPDNVTAVGIPARVIGKSADVVAKA